jgi:hypothetical protein
MNTQYDVLKHNTEVSCLTIEEILECAKGFEGRLPEGWMKIANALELRIRQRLFNSSERLA